MALTQLFFPPAIFEALRAVFMKTQSWCVCYWVATNVSRKLAATFFFRKCVINFWTTIWTTSFTRIYSEITAGSFKTSIPFQLVRTTRIDWKIKGYNCTFACSKNVAKRERKDSKKLKQVRNICIT
jgi:hypothetical protein